MLEIQLLEQIVPDTYSWKSEKSPILTVLANLIMNNSQLSLSLWLTLPRFKLTENDHLNPSFPTSHKIETKNIFSFSFHSDNKVMFHPLKSVPQVKKVGHWLKDKRRRNSTVMHKDKSKEKRLWNRSSQSKVILSKEWSTLASWPLTHLILFP